MPGTSPSFGPFYHDSGGDFFIWKGGAATDLHVSMMAGTSPGQATAQGSNGDLWLVSYPCALDGSTSAPDLGLAMKAVTSPAIAAIIGGFEVAFQGANGNLWTTGTPGRPAQTEQMLAG